MAKNVLILGKSGSGKSASMRNFNNDDLFLINVIAKDLPFQEDFKYKLATDDYNKIKEKLMGATNKDIKTIVIDDAGYLITNKYLRNQGQKKGNAVFELYSEIATDYWDLINFIKYQLPNDVVVYLIMHEDVDDLGNVKPMTIGKMLNEKINIEGMHTIVFRAMKNDRKYIFRTQSSGLDISKTPIGMFENDEIDNDLKVINDRIREFYKIQIKKEIK